MRPVRAAFAIATWAVLSEAQLDSCECINPYTHPSLQGENGIVQYLRGNQLEYAPPAVGKSFIYPPSYGNGCAAHDNGLEPACHTSNRPVWCSQPWCYVDPEACEGAAKLRTKFFPKVENLYFSYGTCQGDGETFVDDSKSPWTNADIEITRRLFGLADNYARGARTIIERVFMGDEGDEDTNTSDADTSRRLGVDATCELTAGHSMCPCNSCFRSSAWASSIDFTEVGLLQSERGTDQEKAMGVCMSQSVASNYKAVAAVEADEDFSNIGYLYFADQATGGYTQWPKEEACSWSSSAGSYDPRYRDWYAAGATGPKDVVIVADVSGSMAEYGRNMLALNATKQILDTLTWKDFASVVLFNNYVSAVYSDHMVPVTESRRAQMKAWANNQRWDGGGTNFEIALTKALQIVKDSVSSGTTCMCQKAIMFLTDGKAEFSEETYRYVHEQARRYDITIFTYTIGSNADTDVAKRLACENRGIFYPVPDKANLKMIMSEYYHYFVQGQEICNSGFVRYTAIQGHQLYGACIPMYDRSKSELSLLGVSCLDVNLIEKLDDMREQKGWQHFKCQASDTTKMCRPLYMTECHRQKLRAAYSEESVCHDTPEYSGDFPDVTSETQCPCQSQTCQDDIEFTDELDYFCDAWVGDDCVNVDPMWGYSDEGIREVQEKCKASCGLCPWNDPCTRSDSSECNLVPVATECRACLGKVSGVDIEGYDMTCPPDAPRDLMAGERAAASPGPPRFDEDGAGRPGRRVLGLLALLALLRGMNSDA